MPAKGPGAGTSFEDMSHEQMLAWLDQANAGTVQAAADRLVAAAKEIRRIAEELKVRPQWVEWKGEGAGAFRTWSADLANSTLRLGDFSEDAAKWLGQASGAIAQAQASTPRDAGSAQANPDAARVTRNVPDASAVTAKSESELAALAAHKEEVRQQAAAQMRKLGQTYELSATQLNALERPRFPPPPGAVQPPESETVITGEAVARPGVSAHSVTSPGIASAAGMAQGQVVVPDASGVQRSVEPPAPQRLSPTDAPSPAYMDINSADTLPRNPQTTTGPAGGPPGADQVKGSATPRTDFIAPVIARGTSASIERPAQQVRAPGIGRTPLPSEQGTVANPVRPPGGTGGVGGGSGIVGGRPVTPPMGGQAGVVPRGVVVGGESTAARGPLGPTVGTPNAVGRVVGQPSQVQGGRSPSSNSGVVGGRPLPNDGVITGRPGQPGRAGAVTSGPSSSGAVGGSGAVRRPIVGGANGGSRPGEGHGVGGARAPQPGSSTNTGGRSGRPYRVVEDEETWRQGGRRAVPPVID